MRITLFTTLCLAFLTLSLFTAAQNGSLKGTLTDTSDDPIAYATITVAKYHTISDQLGNFSFKKIPLGQYLLVVTRTGMIPDSLAIEINPGALTVLDLPGANYSETQGSGFPSNGISFRGLNPSQSIETNTRQNGYNITADIYGYSESYYLPPLEAVDRIEVTRGESSLQFGPQFGGVINYIIKDGNRNKPFEYSTEQTGGSYVFFNSYHAASGQIGKLNYIGFVQYQARQGERLNSDYRQVSKLG